MAIGQTSFRRRVLTSRRILVLNIEILSNAISIHSTYRQPWFLSHVLRYLHLLISQSYARKLMNSNENKISRREMKDRENSFSFYNFHLPMPFYMI